MTSHTCVKTNVVKCKIIHLNLNISFYISIKNMKILIIQSVLREFLLVFSNTVYVLI